jgi:hypothetical protein
MAPLATFSSGDEEARTPDIQLAKLALYQLSYIPKHRSHTAPRRGGPSWVRTRDLMLIKHAL